MDLAGTLYLGYPVLASADEKVLVKAMLVCDEHGLVVFDTSDNLPPRLGEDDWHKLKDDQDKLYGSSPEIGMAASPGPSFFYSECAACW
jgi:superfamily I DNA and RNA helicase